MKRIVNNFCNVLIGKFNKISKNMFEQRQAMNQLRSSMDTLPSTLDLGNSKTRNNFEVFRNNAPTKTVDDLSSRYKFFNFYLGTRLKMTGLSTLKREIGGEEGK